MARIDQFSQKWFQGVDKYTDEEYLIEYIPPEIDKKLKDEATTIIKFTDNDGKKQEKKRFNFDLYQKKLISRAFKSCRGVTIGKDEKPIKVLTPKIKEFIFTHRTDIAVFVGEHCRIPAAFGEYYEELKKNLKTLSNGNLGQNGIKQSMQAVENV